MWVCSLGLINRPSIFFGFTKIPIWRISSHMHNDKLVHSPVNAYCTMIYRRKRFLIQQVDFQLVRKLPRFTGTECSLPCSKAVFFNQVFAINRKINV